MGEEKKNGVVENTDYYSARLFRSAVGCRENFQKYSEYKF
jgi:hypothetical protein